MCSALNLQFKCNFSTVYLVYDECAHSDLTASDSTEGVTVVGYTL